LLCLDLYLHYLVRAQRSRHKISRPPLDQEIGLWNGSEAYTVQQQCKELDRTVFKDAMDMWTMAWSNNKHL